MITRKLNRFNENTNQVEEFYPVTHVDAVIGSKNFITAEETFEISGSAPEIDPTIINYINERFNSFNGGGAGGSYATIE